MLADQLAARLVVIVIDGISLRLVDYRGIYHIAWQSQIQSFQFTAGEGRSVPRPSYAKGVRNRL